MTQYNTMRYTTNGSAADDVAVTVMIVKTMTFMNETTLIPDGAKLVRHGVRRAIHDSVTRTVSCGNARCTKFLKQECRES